MQPTVVVHGGAGSPVEWSDGCEAAARAGAEVLRSGGSALDAAIAAVRLMEDDGRFNAGRGSVLRLDGHTMQMDAGVMDSEGRLGAVAALEGYPHPIEVARAVADTPHVLFCGEGAARFAAVRGFERWDSRPSAEAQERYRRSIDALAEHGRRKPEWTHLDLAAFWNFDEPMPEALRAKDTVGAVATDGRGRFATANSTGGSTPMLLGRVGDSPLAGAGFWAGPAGAVAATGIGEQIIRRLASYEVYRRLERGSDPAGALREVVALFPADVGFAACAISGGGHAVMGNRSIAQASASL